MRQSQAGLHRLDIAEKAGEQSPKALADGPETVMPRPWTWTARLISSLLEPRKGPGLSQVGTRAGAGEVGVVLSREIQKSTGKHKHQR